MPQILVDGELREVTQEEFDAWTAANPGTGEAPAGGDVLQLPTQPEILIPNTSNTSPDQTLNNLYEEFVEIPSTAVPADYYGEDLTKNIENRDYFFPETPEPVTTDDALLARLAQEEIDRAPIVEELSRPVTSGLYTVDPLVKAIEERVYDIPTTLDPITTDAEYLAKLLAEETARASENPTTLDPITTDAEYLARLLQQEAARANETPTTLDPVTTNAEYLARLLEEEAARQIQIRGNGISVPINDQQLYGQDLTKDADLTAKDISTRLTVNVDPTVPLTKNIADRVYSDEPLPVGQQDLYGQEIQYESVIPVRDTPIDTRRDPYVSNQSLYGQNLTTGSVQISKPGAGDTLSGGGAAALIGAATIGAYAYKALFPPNVNDYSRLSEYYKVDGLPPITPESYGPSQAVNYDEYYNQDGLPPIEPENYDAISLDTPYEYQQGLENFTDDTISYDDLVDQEVDPTAPQITDIPGGGFYGEPPPTSPNYTVSYNPETGTYDVIDIDTGQVADTGLSQEAAELAAETANTIGDPAYGTEPEPEVAESDVVTEPVEGLDDPYQDQTGLTEFTADDQVEWTEEDAAGLDSPYQDEEGGAVDLGTGDINYGDELSLDIPYQDGPDGALDFETGEYVTDTTVSADDPLARYGEGADDARAGYEDQAAAAAAAQQAAKANAQAQAELQRQRNQASQGDWRVRLRLAPGSDYLYKAGGSVDATRDAGILGPLVTTDGVIFPYMPQISTVYHATYNPYDLTHSNYRGYFYQNSYVGEITLTAPFTAQDTNEAEYLLAVIHFFRSATKMFYGQDTDHRGSPPPLVFLQGLGQYQFNLHPCVISQFTYNLPNDVDYIRARSKNSDGTNMLTRRNLKPAPSDPFNSALARLASIGQKKGAVNPPPAPPTLGQQSPTYVPTKMEIQLTLLPIQSRAQVSRQFNMTGFANGDLLEGGFW